MTSALTLLFMVLTLSCAPSPLGARMLDAAPSATRAPSAAWHGFNLLNMFWKGWQEEPFKDEDFRLIHELGFNFVRLPLDYRIWKSDPGRLAWIDAAVALGQKYGVHVCLALHRAPGYTVATEEPEAGNLWTDPGLQQAFVGEWTAFAQRYKAVPAASLSFNLVNEPTGAPDETIAAVLRRGAEAVFAISPHRPVVIDGVAWGRRPIKELVGFPVIQATRGYDPREIVRTTPGRAAPAWPQLRVNGYLYGDGKPQLQSRLTLVGTFAAGTLSVLVNRVSGPVTLQIFADGAAVAQQAFAPGPGAGEWAEVIFDEKWHIYQNRYDRRYDFALPRPAKEIALYVATGDWLSFSDVTVGAAKISATDFAGGARQEGPIFLDGAHANPQFDRDWLWAATMRPWLDLQRQGVAVIVGETGGPKTSPHPVYLAWMRDNLENWRRAGWGWALWNFRGEFGILDSGRDGVEYEDFHGHKLDRKLLTLLQSYL